MDETRLHAAFAGIRVLVTGATGFIGQHLCAALVRVGAHVLALRRPNAPRCPGTSPRWFSCHDRVEWLEADIRDTASLTQAIRHACAARIFHLAAATSVERGFQTADVMVATNLQGTINLLRALEGTDYTCFVQTGSAEEYGAGTAPFHEEDPVRPVSPYSASKAAATLFCEMYHRTLDCPIVVVRPFLVYGPGQPPDKLIPQTILAALANRSFPMTSGRQTREFTYIDDIIDGYLRAGMMPEAVGHTINLGTGLSLPVVEVVRLIIQMTGSTTRPDIGALPTRSGEIWSYQCDNTKARNLLGWTPRVSLEEGLRKTIAWYRRMTEQL